MIDSVFAVLLRSFKSTARFDREKESLFGAGVDHSPKPIYRLWVWAWIQGKRNPQERSAMWSLPLICHQRATPARTATQEMGIRPGTPVHSVE